MDSMLLKQKHNERFCMMCLLSTVPCFKSTDMTYGNHKSSTVGVPQGIPASTIFTADAKAKISTYWAEPAGIKALADAKSLPPGLAAWMAAL